MTRTLASTAPTYFNSSWQTLWKSLNLSAICQSGSLWIYLRPGSTCFKMLHFSEQNQCVPYTYWCISLTVTSVSLKCAIPSCNSTTLDTYSQDLLRLCHGPWFLTLQNKSLNYLRPVSNTFGINQTSSLHKVFKIVNQCNVLWDIQRSRSLLCIIMQNRAVNITPMQNFK